MGMNRDHPLGRDFLELQRKTARGYTCPLCGGIFLAEPKLWAHGLRSHPGYLEDLAVMEKAEGGARKRFRQEALDQTQQTTIKTGKAGLSAIDRPAPAKTSTDWSKVVGGNTSNSAKAARPVSAREHPADPEKRIEENIGGLSLDQARPTEQNGSPLSLSNPRKRGVEGEFRSPDTPGEGYNVEPTTTKMRYGNTSSGGRDPGFVHEDGILDDSDYRRGKTGPNQPLWDPGTDSPHTARFGRRDKLNSNVTPLHQSQPLTTDEERALTEKDTLQPHLESLNRRPLIQYPRDGLEGPTRQPKAPAVETKFRNNRSPSRDRCPEDEPLYDPEDEPELLLQPETRPISHEQLVVEVKGIYAGLVMVEAKCIDIDERQTAAAQEKEPSKKTELKNDQWQSLIALHKQLLHEHHDFFLASQHPSASQALSRLAAKYSMPARMWRHGIHAFLEVLRHRLPDSLEHMLAFIYIAYSMMALLYETVPAFEDTWIECLGDLGRYRMAIEDDEPRDREVWSNVAKFWYNKASDKTPNVGRLYHHNAILARPYTLEQLSLYRRSLTCVIPFESAKGSIMTLFNPILQNKDIAQRRPPSFETIFIRAHAILFTSKSTDSSDDFDSSIDEIVKGGLLDTYISRAGSRFKPIGADAGISNIAALFGPTKDGTAKSRLRCAFEKAHHIKEEEKRTTAIHSSESVKLPSSTGPLDADLDHSVMFETNNSEISIGQPSKLASITLEICLKRTHDVNVFPLVHVYLAFLWGLVLVLQTCKYLEQDIFLITIEKDIPWTSLCSFLTMLATDPYAMTSKVWSEEFPRPAKEKGRPLPEDFLLRGQMYTRWLFIANWFADFMADDDERSYDPPSIAQPRKERLLWLGLRIASADRWIRFDTEKTRFSTTDYVDELRAVRSQSETLSNDQDTIMSENGPTDYTPRSMSIAPTESRGGSKASTRASTPTEGFDSDPVALPMTPKAGDTVAASDDVPMMDISPGKQGPASSPDASTLLKEESPTSMDR